MTDREMLSGRVPPELKALVDADPRDNQEVMRSALWREFGGERMADVERRIREKEKRVSMLQNEISERKEDRQKEKQELEALQAKLSKDEAKEQSKLNKAKDAFSNVPNKEITKDNPVVQKWAGRVSLDMGDFIQELKDDDN